ncbi:MAG TPA: hypothetical protein VNB49_02375 [Candidatus Dormibacteraeota bacterium]|nr:hypothetical protein [Candidatus Dormibacteraeota bacterium]
MTQPNMRELPETVKFNLLALAISKAYLRQVRAGVQHYRNKIEAEKPGASRLTANHAVIAEIICEINARGAKPARGASMKPAR